jgi:drug/metabolite transporter (DMT)-like permease
MHSAPAAAPTARAPAATGRGILMVVAAWFLLACMDAGSKKLAQDYAIIQILWVRFVFLLGFAWWLARRQGVARPYFSRRPILQTVRSAILVVEIGLFIFGITVLTLAEAHAILAVTPLLVTAFSVPLLKEQVGIRRWSAIAVAFAGVLIILRPGFGVLQPMSVVPLICAVMFALYQVMTRMVGRDDPAPVTLLWTAAVGAIVLTVIGPFFWTWPDATGWALLLLVAVLGAAGHLLLIGALEAAPASTLQPFSYSILVFATVIGFVMFDNLPDLWTVLGAAIVVACGLYTFARERRLESRASKRATSEERLNANQ